MSKRSKAAHVMRVYDEALWDWFQARAVVLGENVSVVIAAALLEYHDKHLEVDPGMRARTIRPGPSNTVMSKGRQLQYRETHFTGGQSGGDEETPGIVPRHAPRQAAGHRHQGGDRGARAGDGARVDAGGSAGGGAEGSGSARAKPKIDVGF